MTEHEAFLRQARSDFAVFEMLMAQDREHVPACHPLHYLQMATEKLAKAAAIASGMRESDKYSHVAFSLLPRQLSRRDVARRLGWNNFKTYQAFLRRAAPTFHAIEELNPSVGPSRPGGGSQSGPNVEYPWNVHDRAGNVSWQVPAEHHFHLMDQLQRSGVAVQVLTFVTSLLDRFEAVFSE